MNSNNTTNLTLSTESQIFEILCFYVYILCKKINYYNNDKNLTLSTKKGNSKYLWLYTNKYRWWEYQT